MTLLGIVTLVRELQSWNAESPIEVTLLGIVTLVREIQWQNVLSPIEVTPFSTTMFVIQERLSYHGTSEYKTQFVISPVPEMVSKPSLSSVHVRLSPHSPLSTMLAASVSIADNGSTANIISVKIRTEKNFFIIPSTPLL